MLDPSPLGAQVEWKDRPVTLAPLDQHAPVIARPANTSFTITVWEDDRHPQQRQLYAQRIDNVHGLAHWSTVDGVAVTEMNEPLFQTHPRAAYDSLGGVIITWEQRELSDGTASIYAQRLMVATGERDPNWPPEGLAICSGHHATRPRIVGTPDGAYITWIDERKGLADDRDVYIQYIKYDALLAPGTWVTNGIEVPGLSSSDQINPELDLDHVWLPDQQFVPQQGVVVVCQDNRNRSTSSGQFVWNVFATRIDFSGSRQYADVVVGLDTTRIEAQTLPRIVVTGEDSTKKYSHPVIVWEDARYSDSLGLDIYGQRLDESGAITWAGHEGGIVICSAEGDQRFPTLTLSERPERASVQLDYAAWVTIAWEDSRTARTGVFAALASLGSTSAELLLENPNGTSGELIAMVDDYDLDQIDLDTQPWIQDEYCDVNIVWRRPRGSSASDVFYQCIRIPQWDIQKQEGGWPVTEAKREQNLPQVGKAVFVFEDGRRQPIGVSGVYADDQDDFNISCQTPGECTGPTQMGWRDMYAKWNAESDAENMRATIDPIDNSTFVVWDEERLDPGKRLVYIQKFDKTGVPRWTNGGVLVTVGHDSSSAGECSVAHFADVCPDHRGGAYVAWEQQLDGAAPQVWFTRVNVNGDIDGTFYRTKANVELSKPRIVFCDSTDLWPNYGGGQGIFLAALQKCGNENKLMVMRPDAEYPNPDVEILFDQYAGDFCDVMLSKCPVRYPDHESSTGYYLTARTTNAPGNILVVRGRIREVGYYFVHDAYPTTIAFTEFAGYDLHTSRYADVDGGGSIASSAFLAYAIKRQAGDPVDIYLDDIHVTDCIPSITMNLTNHIDTTYASSLPSLTTDGIPSYYNGIRWSLEGALVAWNTTYPIGLSSSKRNKLETSRVTYHLIQATPTIYSSRQHDVVLVQDNFPLPIASDIGNPLSSTDSPFGLIIWADGNEQSSCSPPRSVEVVGQLVRYEDQSQQPLIWQTPQAISPGTGSYAQFSPQIIESVLSDTSQSVFWYDTRTGVRNVMGTRVYDMLRSGPAWKKNCTQDEMHIETAGPSNAPHFYVYPSPLSLSGSGDAVLHLQHDGHVVVQLVDILGRKLMTLHQGTLAAGEHHWPVIPSAMTATSGVYYWKVVVDDTMRIIPTVLVR